MHHGPSLPRDHQGAAGRAQGHSAHRPRPQVALHVAPGTPSRRHPIPRAQCSSSPPGRSGDVLLHTMRFGSTAKVLAECKLKYYRISECPGSCSCLLLAESHASCFL